MQMQSARADMIGPDLALIEVCVCVCVCVRVRVRISCYGCGHDCGAVLVAVSITVIVVNVLLFKRAGRGIKHNMQNYGINRYTHTHTHVQIIFKLSLNCVVNSQSCHVSSS